MKNKIILFFLITIISSAFFLLPATISAQTNYGLDETANNIGAFKNASQNYNGDFLQTKTGQIISVVLSFIGALFLVLMIYAGIMWMISQGNEQQVTKSKDLMINAVIGMIIVFAAYAITTFLGTQLLQ